jgi:CHAT domain-containing protein
MRRWGAVWLLAFMVVSGAPPSAAALATVSSRAAALDARLAAHLAAGRVPSAVAVAESLARERTRRGAGRPLAVASYLDTLGLRFLASGVPEGWQAARGFFSRALALRESAVGPDHPEVAATLSLIAAAWDYEGRWTEALPLEERSLAIRVRLRGERHPSVAASRRQIGLFLFQLGRYAEAEPMLARSLAIYDSLPGDHTGSIVDGLNNMAEISRVQDRYEEAAGYFERGLAIAAARLPAGGPLAGALRNNLAGLYKDMGRYDDAEPLLADILQELERAPSLDREALATARLNLAEVYRLQDRAEEAEPLYRRALAEARRALPAESPELVPFVNQAAVGFQALGRPELAEPLYRETLARAERALGADHPLVAQSLHDLAVLMAERGSTREAADTLRRALAIRGRTLGEDHPEAAVTRVELARCLWADRERGDQAAASELERATAVLDRTAAYPAARLEAYALRARMHAEEGRLEPAIADLAVALALVDTLRATHGGGDQSRGSFMARHLDLYHRMVRWRLERGDLAAALEAHERARARILLDRLAAGDVDLRAGIPIDVRAPLERDEREARGRLASAQRRMGEARLRTDLSEPARWEAIAALETARDSAARALQGAQETLKERSPLWRDVLSARGRPASLAEIQRELLGRGELLLLYHTGIDRSYLMVIPAGPGPPAFHELTLDSAAARELREPPGPLTSGQLERIIAGERDRAALGSAAPLAALLALRGEAERVLESQRDPSGPGLLERRLRALARALLPEVAWREIRRARQVVLVPDGALHLLPFEALVTRMRARDADTRYWLDEGPPVRYAASATSLLSLTRAPAPRAAAATGPRALSVSDPAYGPAAGQGTWAPLPWTTRESEALRRAFAPESVLVCAGSAASEARVRAALTGRSLVHFATHGFVTERQSDVLAGLVLAPSELDTARAEDDGLLQLHEIYELRLACELAVLSACGTQRGRRVPGEGVFALSRGFMAAGARRVVASLWEVSDESTARLMEGFFAGIAPATRAGRTPPYAEALRDARRRLRSDPRWADPFHWAPFTLAGLR